MTETTFVPFDISGLDHTRDVPDGFEWDVDMAVNGLCHHSLPSATCRFCTEEAWG